MGQASVCPEGRAISTRSAGGLTSAEACGLGAGAGSSASSTDLLGAGAAGDAGVTSRGLSVTVGLRAGSAGS